MLYESCSGIGHRVTRECIFAYLSPIIILRSIFFLHNQKERVLLFKSEFILIIEWQLSWLPVTPVAWKNCYSFIRALMLNVEFSSCFTKIRRKRNLATYLVAAVRRK